MFPFCSYEEEEYDYYRGPRKKPVHERLTLPSRSPPRYQEQEIEYSSEEEKPKKGRKRSYENFKVTIQNESDDDGTPSLSGMDDTASSRSSSFVSSPRRLKRDTRDIRDTRRRRPRTPPEPKAKRPTRRTSPRRPNRRPPSPPLQRY